MSVGKNTSLKVLNWWLFESDLKKQQQSVQPFQPPTRAPILYPHLNALDLVIAKCTWFLCGHPKFEDDNSFTCWHIHAQISYCSLSKIRRTIWGDKDTAYCIGHVLIGIKWCWILSIKSTQPSLPPWKYSIQQYLGQVALDWTACIAWNMVKPYWLPTKKKGSWPTLGNQKAKPSFSIYP